jgi:hypothetical protein
MPRKKSNSVEPCSNDDCRFPTRPYRTRLEDFPRTRQRKKGQCQRCFEKENPEVRVRTNKIPLGNPDPHIVAGLERLMADRDRRKAAAARRLYPEMARRQA